MGEFVRDLLEKRHIKVASMARAMGIDPKSAPSYWTSAVITDDVLMRMTNALGWDLYSIVKNEQAKRTIAPALSSSDSSASTVSEPVTRYERRPASASDKGMVLMVNLDEFEELEQLKLLKYLNNAPRKAGAQRTAI